MKISVDVRNGDATARDDLIADLEEMGFEMCDFSGSVLEIDTYEFESEGPVDLEDLNYTVRLGFPDVQYKVLET